MPGPVQQAHTHGQQRSRRVAHFAIVAAAEVIENMHGESTHRGARTHDHKVKGLALYRLS